MRDARRATGLRPVLVLGWVVGLSLAHAARADVGSTADEWAARFVPEAAPPIALPAYADAYDRVAADLNAGLYRRAMSDLFVVPRPDPARTNALRAEALIGLGETGAATELLSAPPLADDPQALARRAGLLLDAGDAAGALSLVGRLLEKSPSWWPARALEGRALEMAGRFKDAIAADHWFLEPQQDALEKWQSDPDSFDNAADLVALADAVHRWATLTTAYKDTPRLNDTVLAMYTRAFDVVDRGNVAARVAAARFCLARGDTERAAGLLKPLQDRVPNNREVLRASGELAVAAGAERPMHEVIDALRDEDPDSPDAGLVEIVTLARARSVAAADRATRLAAAHPQRLDLAGVAAALAYVNGRPAGLDVALKAADATEPARSDAYVAAAQILEMASQRTAAVALLKTAIDRTPWETTPRHLLGDLYLNDGYNDQSKAVLDEAYALDPYNVKTLNYLRLLDDLSKYDQRTSEHFIIFSDKDADPISAEQIGAYMESVYADVCGVFEYEPKTKVVIQIYPEDDAFSVRMAGVPGVENFGVSFGRVLATIAPRKGTNQGNFNWARVLRHEFVHTVNLLQTDNRCPRWLTEGLAVWQEHVPFRFADVPKELYQRTMNDTLFSVRGFPLAYIRPTRPGDGEQAYTQGAYLAMYLDETFGRHSIVKLLNAYAQSKPDEVCFQDATGEPMAKFEADWHAWMKAKLKPWGYDDATTAKAATLQDEGDAFIKAKQLPEALTAYQAASDLQPTEVKPHQRLAYLYLQKSLYDPAKAIEHLKFLHVLELQDDRYAKQICRLYTRMNDVPNALPNALHWAKEATYVDLYDPVAHDLVADLYAKSGDPEAAAAERQAAAQVRLWEGKRTAAAAAGEK